jgi:hypothetical protein
MLQLLSASISIADSHNSNEIIMQVNNSIDSNSNETSTDFTTTSAIASMNTTTLPGN